MSPSKSLMTAMALMAAVTIVMPAAATAEPIDRPAPSVNAVVNHSQSAGELPLGVVRATGGVNGAADSSALEHPAGGIQVESATRGFDWGDAAIGAMAMLALLSLGAGVLLIARRGREREQPAATG